MGYYGFSPQQKNRGATIAGVGAMIGQTVAGLPKIIREEKKFKYDEEQRKKAIEAIQKDSTQMDLAYKALKGQIKTRGTPLVAAKIMTQEELDSYLSMLPMLKESDKLDVKSLNGYIERFGSIRQKLIDTITSKEKKLQIKGAIAGKPAEVGTLPSGIPGQSRESATLATQPIIPGEEAVPGQSQGLGQAGGAATIPQANLQSGRAFEVSPAIAPAQNKENASKMLGAGITSPEAEDIPAYNELPKQSDIDKSKFAEEKWSEEMKIKKARLNQAQKAAKDKGDDQFFKESEALFTDAKDYEIIVTKTESLMGEKETEVQELENERQQIMQKLDAPPDQGGYVMPEEEQEAEKRLEEIRKAKLAANKEAISMREKLLNQNKKKMIADEALDKYIATGGRIGFAGALSQGQKKSKELGSTSQPTVSERTQGIPTQAPKQTMQPKARTPQDESAIKWAQDMLRKDPNDTIALRIMKVNGL